MPEPHISLTGVFPPIPTPFQSDQSIDIDHLVSNLERWNQQMLAGYVIGGSNGEFVSLTPDERVEVVQIARKVIPRDRLLIAGSGMESTRQTINLTRRMAECGADAALVVTPSYYTSKMTSDALENHYRMVADSSPLPIILYSVPANTGVDLPVETVIRLADHPNIIGIKDSGGSVIKIGLMVHETPETFQVIAGSGGFMLGALAVGAIGVVGALANIAGNAMAEMIARFQTGDMTGARSIQLPLIEVNSAVTSRFGVPGLKAAMDLLGFFGGPVRPPLLPLSEDDIAILEQILRKARLL